MRTAAFILLGMRYPKEPSVQLFHGVTAVEESTTYQWIMDKVKIAEAKKLLL